MTGFYIAAGILAFLALLLFVKIKVRIKGVNTVWSIYIGILIFRYTIYPRPPKKGKSVERIKEKPREKPDNKNIKRVIGVILEDPERYLRAVTVDKLKILLKIATGNAAETALYYGKAAAAVGIILPFADKVFIIKRQKIDINADFESSKPEIKGDIIISTNMCRVSAAMIYFMLKIHARTKREA